MSASILLNVGLHSSDIGGNSTLTTPTEETAHAPLTHEWSSAVGHAGTGKSGRVIHNLQEDIARLNRECTLQQLRADETRQANETLKLQLKSLQEARDHAQQLHETDLHSISLRDRKIAALQTELARERERRGKSEEDARRTNQIAAGERDTHHREVAEAQELAAHLQVQYETLAKAQSRDRGETQARINRFKGEIAEIVARETERQRQIVRLDVIMEQKNREQDLQGERMHNFIRLFDEYRERNDELVSGMLGQAGLNDKKIDALAEQATDAIQKFKWATTLQSAKEQEQEKSENGQQ